MGQGGWDREGGTGRAGQGGQYGEWDREGGTGRVYREGGTGKAGQGHMHTLIKLCIQSIIRTCTHDLL